MQRPMAWYVRAGRGLAYDVGGLAYDVGGLAYDERES